MSRDNELETVARKSSKGGIYICAGGCIRAGGLDIQIWQKFH